MQVSFLSKDRYLEKTGLNARLVNPDVRMTVGSTINDSVILAHHHKPFLVIKRSFKNEVCNAVENPIKPIEKPHFMHEADRFKIDFPPWIRPQGSMVLTFATDIA